MIEEIHHLPAYGPEHDLPRWAFGSFLFWVMGDGILRVFGDTVGIVAGTIVAVIWTIYFVTHLTSAAIERELNA